MGRIDRDGEDGVTTSDRRMTRRRMLGLAGVLSLGATGSAALAACEEPRAIERVATQTTEKEVKVPAERILKKETTVEVEQSKAGHVCEVVTAAVGPEARPASSWVDVRFATNHTAGPRGAAIRWGLAQFAKHQPEIRVTLEPAANLTDSLAVQSVAKSAPHLTLLSQSDFLRFHEADAFTEITDELGKRDDFHPEDFYFLSDAYTFNNIDHSFPQPAAMSGPQFGMPFQIDISGFVGNISLAEAAGVTLPDSDGGWTWNDWTEWDAMLTDPDTGEYVWHLGTRRLRVPVHAADVLEWHGQAV